MKEITLLQIRDVVREENEKLLEKVQKWTSENFSSKIQLNNEVSSLKENHIQPIKTKIYGATIAASIMFAVSQFFVK